MNNSIHFEVSWKKGGKSRSFYMRKPPHYFVYQLAIDIEAHIKVRADSQVLSLYGAELQPFQRLSSCGLRDGDIIQLMRRTGKQQAVQPGRQHQPAAGASATCVSQKAVTADMQLPAVVFEPRASLSRFSFELRRLRAVCYVVRKRSVLVSMRQQG